MLESCLWIILRAVLGVLGGLAICAAVLYGWHGIRRLAGRGVLGDFKALFLGSLQMSFILIAFGLVLGFAAHVALSDTHPSGTHTSPFTTVNSTEHPKIYNENPVILDPIVALGWLGGAGLSAALYRIARWRQEREDANSGWRI